MGELLNLRRGMAQLGIAEPLAARVSVDASAFDPLARLLADVAMGNERSFARLYELTGGRLLAIARSIVGRTDVAEDVLQDSFLRVWRWAHRFDPAKGSAYGWLVRVVRNRALTARATLQRREGGQEPLDAETLVLASPIRPIRRCAARRRGGSIHASPTCRPITAGRCRWSISRA